jgi:hypothetical protein
MATASAGRRDAPADGTPERRTTQVVGPVLLVAVAAGLLGQGAYYPSVQRPFGVLLAVAGLLAWVERPLNSDDIRLPAVLPALALAAWAVLDGALIGVARAGVGPGLLLIGLVVVLLICRHLRREDREVLLGGSIGIGLLVALTGWLGVAGRVGAWSFQTQGLWRASSTLTYPNATAAVLGPLGVVVLGRLVGRPRSVPLAVAAAGLLAGLAATMSRAGVIALAMGLVVLAALLGVRAVARAAVGPVAGALVAMLGLLPSMPAAGRPQPVLALVGLGAGLALAAVTARFRWEAATVVLGGVLLATIAGLSGGDGVGDAGRALAEARVNLASPDRIDASHAALRLVAQQPLTGTGPGHADLRWRGDDRGVQLFAYVHNEYLQLTAELGLVGLALLGILLVALARLLWCARPADPGAARASWAGVVAAAAAFAVHSGFDFVWHLPAVVVTVTLLVGLVLPAPAHQPSVPIQKEELDENQAAH